MIFTIFASGLLGSSFLILLLAIYLLFHIKSELSELGMEYLARNLELKASIKEQVKGCVDFYLSNTAQKK